MVGSMQKYLYFVQRLIDFIIINGLGSLDEKCRPKQPTATATINFVFWLRSIWGGLHVTSYIRNDSRA